MAKSSESRLAAIHKYDAKRKDRYKTDVQYRERNLLACEKYRNSHREQLKLRAAQRYQTMKRTLITLYGGKCSCPGCDETHVEFLSFHHVDGGGNQERKELSPTGVFKKLLKAGTVLEGYQLLCHNCNGALAYYSYCPHYVLPQPW